VNKLNVLEGKRQHGDADTFPRKQQRVNDTMELAMMQVAQSEDLKELQEMQEALCEEFLCPFTTELMVDPVTATCGHSFGRKEIERYISGLKPTVMSHSGLVQPRQHQNTSCSL
jgi:hypothetical protein